MAVRTTIMLDEDTRTAARELAHRYGCSTSEAIRRAVMGHREVVLGVPDAQRQQRARILNRLFQLFEGHDAADEIRRLKEQDEGF
ncbi:MAG: hypothetical protein OXE40_00350 [Gammaproteobacteria bacterium]|nr:hypothetical protein [Gammaproteobacteria bacterium]